MPGPARGGTARRGGARAGHGAMPPSALNQPLLVSMDRESVYDNIVVRLAKRCCTFTCSALYLDIPMSSE